MLYLQYTDYRESGMNLSLHSFRSATETVAIFWKNVGENLNTHYIEPMEKELYIDRFEYFCCFSFSSVY